MKQYQANTEKDYQNESHLAKRRKAEAKHQTPRNLKELKEMVDEFDDEEDSLEQYVRYIR